MRAWLEDSAQSHEGHEVHEEVRGLGRDSIFDVLDLFLKNAGYGETRVDELALVNFVFFGASCLVFNSQCPF